MPIIDLESVGAFVLAREALTTIEGALARGRKQGTEALALAAGRMQGGRFILDAAFVPRQRATAVSVRLSEGSLIPIHASLAETGHVIGLQVHSHPADAFHSTVDDSDDTVTQVGSLSLVVPRFGAFGLEDFPECVLYRRTEDGWSEAITGRDISAALELGP